MTKLAGRTGLITGGGSGIGRATALCLGELGMDVAVHYFRNADGANETAAALRAMGRKAEIFQADLSRAANARALVADVAAQFGHIDVLVNNAGDLIERRPLLEITEDLWQCAINLNLSSAFFCTQEVARQMIGNGGGVIVNVSSLAAHNGGGPGAAPYATAKGALLSFTKAVAKELAPKGIRVNAVAPGLIGETNFHGRFTGRETFDNIVRTIPAGRAGTPEDVARVIAFLVGDDSAYLVGETIDITGGLHVR